MTLKAAKKKVRSSRRATRPATTPAKKQSKPSAPSLFTLFPTFRKNAYVERLATHRQGLIAELHDTYRHRGLVLYLGAGVSRSVGLPSWTELIRALAVTMMTRKVETAVDALGTSPADPVRYWEALQAIQQEVESEIDPDKPILMMARSVKDELGERLPETVARTLYRHFRGRALFMPGRKEPPFPHSASSALRRRLPTSPLLDAVVSLARAERDVSGVQAIINYNYDDLVEQRLKEDSVRCLTVRSGRDQVPEGVLPCYHVHGVLGIQDAFTRGAYQRQGATGNMVFSEEEYHAEYADPYRWSNMTQISHLGRYTGLFVGLSMADPNIRRLLDVMHTQYPELSNYAILTRQRPLAPAGDSKRTVLRNLFESVETNSFSRIGVKVIWVDKHEDVPGVLNAICGVASGNPHPASDRKDPRTRRDA